jgi:AcrR family transcriptional regulator
VKVPPRGEATKAQLLEAAERLFAERGIDGVSLREINSVAQQRNNVALQYHFENRDGLLRAIAEKHLPRIEARQDELFARAEAQARVTDLRAMVEVVWRPAAEYIAEGPSARAWLQIGGELATRPQTARGDLSDSAGTSAWKAGVAVFEHLRGCGLPADFARQRIWASSEAVMHVIASRARLEDAPGARRPAVPLELFVADLIDTTCAGLAAPMSDQTRHAFDACGGGPAVPLPRSGVSE